MIQNQKNTTNLYLCLLILNTKNYIKRENTYDIVLVLNYNMNPIKKNKGSAIFIHVANNNYKSTEGCIAIKKNNLLKILKEIKTNSGVKISAQK